MSAVWFGVATCDMIEQAFGHVTENPALFYLIFQTENDLTFSGTLSGTFSWHIFKHMFGHILRHMFRDIFGHISRHMSMFQNWPWHNPLWAERTQEAPHESQNNQQSGSLAWDHFASVMLKLRLKQGNIICVCRKRRFSVTDAAVRDHIHT